MARDNSSREVGICWFRCSSSHYKHNVTDYDKCGLTYKKRKCAEWLNPENVFSPCWLLLPGWVALSVVLLWLQEISSLWRGRLPALRSHSDSPLPPQLSAGQTEQSSHWASYHLPSILIKLSLNVTRTLWTTPTVQWENLPLSFKPCRQHESLLASWSAGSAGSCWSQWTEAPGDGREPPAGVGSGCPESAHLQTVWRILWSARCWGAPQSHGSTKIKTCILYRDVALILLLRVSIVSYLQSIISWNKFQSTEAWLLTSSLCSLHLSFHIISAQIKHSFIALKMCSGQLNWYFLLCMWIFEQWLTSTWILRK